MRYFNRFILLVLIIISCLIGIFDSFIIKPVSYLLYILTIGIMFAYVINEIKNKKNMRVNIYFLFICIAMFLGIIFRNEKSPLYAIGFIGMIFSYYSINAVEFNNKFFNKVALFISFASIPTIIFNGIFSTRLIGGTSFSGRLNPFMYIPYILIAKELNNDKKWLKMLLNLILILDLIDMNWSESRASLMGLIVIFIIYMFMKKSRDIASENNKKILKNICLIIVIIQIAMPAIYIALYNNFESQLNEITFKYTGKSFFSGRQGVWLELFKTLNKDSMFGTGDVLYKNQTLTAHNEFMNIYYCWGIIVAIFIYLYIYSIFRFAIKKANTKLDIIILLSYLSVLICTTFETYLYTVHFYIFNTIYISYLIGKEEKNE